MQMMLLTRRFCPSIRKSKLGTHGTGIVLMQDDGRRHLLRATLPSPGCWRGASVPDGELRLDKCRGETQSRYEIQGRHFSDVSWLTGFSNSEEEEEGLKIGGLPGVGQIVVFLCFFAQVR